VVQNVPEDAIAERDVVASAVQRVLPPRLADDRARAQRDRLERVLLYRHETQVLPQERARVVLAVEPADVASDVT
jgi:hypothetical protein